jgi:DMSO/TMAO reductase YedYZ molybdopterin-dependent catalytic subunit
MLVHFFGRVDMNWKNVGHAVIAVILSLSFIVLASCNASAAKIISLPGTEVKEYQGENLSSINDFRENSIKGPQYIDINTYQLQITGLVASSANYTYDEIVNNLTSYEKVVKLNCVEGWSVNILWQGMQVRDILAQAKPLPEAKVVIFHAYDGYTTSFPIEYIMNNPILMAYKMNDVTIPPERGFPFMLVAESKWGYKWIKWITRIELSDNISYKGYWEERGYSNQGDLDKSFFDNPSLLPF